MLCAPIIGINNHGQTILFGCGVIDGESEVWLEWLFNTFLEAMEGKKPTTILTDQATGIERDLKSWKKVGKLCLTIMMV